MRLHLLIIVCVALAGAACSSSEPRASTVATDTAPAGSVSVGSSSATASRSRIVVLGDSLTAGLGLSLDQAYPSLLQSKLDDEGYLYEVINGGLSGDTTAGGLRRLDWTLEGDVRILILALGANDGLRGTPVESMKENLSAMIERAKRRGIRVVLAGMEAPPNLGTAYTEEFRTAFHDLAQRHDVTFIPFLLEGVAGVTELNQGDRIHPNRAGARRIADHVWTSLEPLVRQDAARR